MLRRIVVADNEHYQDGPDVVLTRNAALVCVYIEADALVPAWSNVMVTVSTDCGETWSPGHVLAKSSKAQDGYCWDSPRISVLPDGQLALVANYSFQEDAKEVSVWMWRSDDDGRNWSEPSRVIPEGIAPDRICALPSGRLLLNADCDISDEPPKGQELYMSDDNGVSWHKLSTIIHPPQTRGSIVVFDGNTLVCYLGRSKIDFHCLKAVSKDSGKTWSTTHTPIVAHRPCAGLLRSGRMLVTYRFPGAGTYAYLERKESALSLDPDKQQGLLLQLESGGNNYWWDYGYSGWTQLPDSRAFCVYHAKQPTTTAPPQTTAPSIKGVWFSEDDFAGQ